MLTEQNDQSHYCMLKNVNMYFQQTYIQQTQ